MENFTFYSPIFFSFGKGMENEAGKLAKRFGAKKEDIWIDGLARSFELSFIRLTFSRYILPTGFII